MGRLKMIKPQLGGLAPRLRIPPKKADSFYLSKEWRALVADIKRKRGAFCQRCGSGHRVIGDHIKEIKDGGAKLDARNVKLLCQSCHNQKTSAAKARRQSG